MQSREECPRVGLLPLHLLDAVTVEGPTGKYENDELILTADVDHLVPSATRSGQGGFGRNSCPRGLAIVRLARRSDAGRRDSPRPRNQTVRGLST